VRQLPEYLLGTDVLIRQLRRRERTVTLLRALVEAGPLGCSVLSVSEVLRLVRGQEVLRTQRLLDALVAVPVDRSTAVLAATIMRRDGPGYVDCHIAATALLLGVPVVTYNRRDYERTGVVLFDTSDW
jgi:predicted nucleic acid-binding protein